MSGSFEGTPIFRIMEKDTFKTVGWLYQWQDGNVSTLWLTKTSKPVLYLPIVEHEKMIVKDGDPSK